MRFFRNPWKASVTSEGCHVNWREEIGIEFIIPPGAVPEGKELDLSVWPCTAGPFHLPEGYELSSPVYLISPSFQFSCPITVTMYHYCVVETEEDGGSMAFLSSPTTPHWGEDHTPHYQFRVLGKGTFKPSEAYGSISLKHFCTLGSGTKRKNESNSSEGTSRKRQKGKCYVSVLSNGVGRGEASTPNSVAPPSNDSDKMNITWVCSYKHPVLTQPQKLLYIPIIQLTPPKLKCRLIETCSIVWKSIFLSAQYVKVISP